MAPDEIVDFLESIDEELVKLAQGGKTLELYLIGRSA
jgi:hypothetical protein